jgi:hypothetical protein
MSPQFIDREGEDLFAQACFGYSRQRAEGRRIANPVTCGRHRPVGLLESRDWRPRIVSTERVGELGEGDATPEQVFLSEERNRRVRELIERLPDSRPRLPSPFVEPVVVTENPARHELAPQKSRNTTGQPIVYLGL